MGNNSRYHCYTVLTVLFAIIVGVTFALLFRYGYFLNVAATLYTALGAAAIFFIAQIIYGLLYAAYAIRRRMPQPLAPLAILNAAGTVLTIGAVMLTLAVHLVPAALSAVVLSSVCAFSFTLMIGSFILMLCWLCRNKSCTEEQPPEWSRD